MRNSCYKSLCLFIVVFNTFIITSNASGTQEILPDSLLTEDHIYEYTFTDFDKAADIIKQMRERKLLPEHRLDIAEGDLYFNTGKYYRALVYYKRTLENDSVRSNARDYMEQLHRMISCYDCLHDESKKMYYVRLLLAKSKQYSDTAMQSIALFNMGKMLYYQENKKRGYRMMQEAVGLMKRSNYKYKYDNLRYEFNTLLIMYQRDKCYEKALKTLDMLQDVVNESADAEPVIDGLKTKELKTLYAQRAVLLSRTGRLEEAENAYRNWRMIGAKYSKDDYLIIPYLMDRKRFDEVIGMYKSREKSLREKHDTINYHMMAVKRTLGKAYKEKQDYRKASGYFEQLANLTDSLKVREQQSNVIELATIYETSEKESQLQKQRAELTIRSTLLLSACGIIALLLIMLWRNIRHTKVIKRKNTILAGNIEELMNYKEEQKKRKVELYRIKNMHREDRPELPENNLSAHLETGDQTSGTVGDENVEKERANIHREENQCLFDQMDHLVIRDKLYLNPDLSREELMKLAGVEKNRFGQILQQCANSNVTTYINHKRLDYATKLLKKYPNYTISTIAEACGIPNTPTFNRLFKEKFGMRPTDYRKEVMSESKI